MFVKITTSGPRQYVKLVESYRDPAGGTSPTGHRHPGAHRSGAIRRG
jgi:hypothetical protein